MPCFGSPHNGEIQGRLPLSDATIPTCTKKVLVGVVVFYLPLEHNALKAFFYMPINPSQPKLFSESLFLLQGDLSRAIIPTPLPGVMVPQRVGINLPSHAVTKACCHNVLELICQAIRRRRSMLPQRAGINLPSNPMPTKHSPLKYKTSTTRRN
jgi:hypothetical protein